MGGGPLGLRGGAVVVAGVLASASCPDRRRSDLDAPGCMAAWAAICEAVRLAREALRSDAVGRVGSKKPWECCLALSRLTAECDIVGETLRKGRSCAAPLATFVVLVRLVVLEAAPAFLAYGGAR